MATKKKKATPPQVSDDGSVEYQLSLPVKPRPVGRPTDYRPEYCAMLIEHMSKGLSFETFGALVDASKQTVYDWEARFPEFLDAKKQAFTKCQLFWENIGVEGIWNYPESRTLNTGNYVFQMKNRFKWTDRVDVAGSVVHKVNQLEQAPDDELDKILGDV